MKSHRDGVGGFLDPLIVDPPDQCLDVGLGKVRSMLRPEDAPGTSGTRFGSFRTDFILVSGMDPRGMGLPGIDQ